MQHNPVIENPAAFTVPEEELLVKDVAYGYVIAEKNQNGQTRKELMHDGYALVSHQVVKDGLPVRWLYREQPSETFLPDTGWRLFSGLEDEEYTEDSDHFGYYSHARIANYQPELIALLDAPVGAVFEKPDETGGFVPVEDWQLPEEE